MIKKKIPEYIRRVPLLKNLNDRQLKEIVKITESRTYPRGRYVFIENEIGDKVYIVLEGTVKIFTSSADGRIKALGLLREGDIFGEMSLIDKERRSASARALEQTRVLIISHINFKKKLMSNPEINWRITQTLSRRLRQADMQIKDLAFKSINGRIASCLLDLSARYGRTAGTGREIILKLTHHELADIVGTSRETITKILSEFKAEGSIMVNTNKKIVVTNEDELKTWIT